MLRIGRREGEHETGASPRRIGRGDVSPEQARILAGDGETQAAPPAGGAAGIGLVEAVEDERQMRWRDSRTAVGDRDMDSGLPGSPAEEPDRVSMVTGAAPCWRAFSTRLTMMRSSRRLSA